ncbi:MAG TPA: molybdopterin cofactor-binding domain-containing protein [Polyangiaceae bacterium]
MTAFVLTRRAVLASFGLAVGTLAIGPVARAAVAAAASPGGAGLAPNAFVHVAADGIVTLVCARSEMGQGVRSSLPALIAAELGADRARVRIVQADGDARFGNQDTDGSSSVRGNRYDELRRLGAVARTMLVEAAARRWHVPPVECEAREHAVWHAKSRRSLSFGELAESAAQLPVPSDEHVVLRSRAELGLDRPMPHVDAPDIVHGKAVFGADVRLPGMLTAVIARPPVVGGKVASHDASRALAVPGVRKVVTLPAPKPPFGFQPLGGVAVLADNTWAAMRGRAALQVSWDLGPNATYDSAAYRQELLAAVRAPGERVRDVGDVDRALAGSARRVVAEYTVPHLAHAPMEPPASVARFDGERCEVWSPTQSPQDARSEVASALGIDASRVTVHTMLLGGAFGRKAKPDYDVEAALLSRAAGAPVRVQWTRTDDIQHGYYHTTCAQRLEAGLDAGGKLTAWSHRTAFPPIGSTFKEGTVHASDGELGQGILDMPLAAPSVRAENGAATAHVRIGWLRSVSNINHAFAIGSFVDEIAYARGVDPLTNWLDVLGPARLVSAAELGVKKVPNYGAPLERYPVDVGRLRRALERVAELSRWRDRAREGRTLGISVHRSFLTYVAVVASVVLDERGRPRADEGWVVADPGTIVNADRVRSQMEGAFIFGASIALHGAITAKAGAIEQTNFRDYRVVRMNEGPRAVHVEIVESDAPPGGVGEPGVPPVAPAIANAFFARTGRRVRDLPIIA